VANISQAKAIPGTALVVFIDNNTLERNPYYINFDINSAGDEFDGESVGKQWKWIRGKQSQPQLHNKTGWLSVTSETGDVSEGSNNAKNILLQVQTTTGLLKTKLVCSRAPSQPENAGIIAYGDDNNFVKLMLRAVTKTTRQRGVQPGTLDFLIEENGIAKSVASFNLRNQIVGDTTLVLKLEKKGDNTLHTIQQAAKN